MKISGKDITMKNVWAYIQGTGRKKLMEDYPDIYQSPRHIQEQIVWREVIANKQCFTSGQCISKCKCKMPDKLYSDKACDDGCYPEMMDRDQWFRFKQYCARKKIDAYNRKFDWETALADMDDLDGVYYSTLICVDKSSVHLGVGRAGDILKHTFELFNPDVEDLTINTIQPSCNCTKVYHDKVIKPNTYGKLETFIDTNNLQLGEHEIWLSIRYNIIKRLNLKLTYTLK